MGEGLKVKQSETERNRGEYGEKPARGWECKGEGQEKPGEGG